jgi:cytochrome oxidase Cu insertion factor (SCO1/SenC/PrrC family)
MRALAAAAFLALAIVSAAAQPPPMPDLATVGPQVGAKVPSFTLPDQTGESRSLESLIGPKGAILVFFRSADW